MKKPIATFLTDTHLKESNLQINHTIYKEAIDHTKSLGLDRIFHLGDIFDSRTSQTIELLKDGFFDILEIFKEEKLNLVAISGNHDRTQYSSINSFLTTYQYHPNFKLVEKYDYFQLTKEIVLFLLPFFDDTTYNKYLKEMVKEHNIKTNDTHQIILGTHIGITGAVMNNGVEVHSDVDTSFLKLFKKIFVGHYHNEMVFDNVHYIGSAIAHNFGETNNKGLTVLYDDLSTEKLPLTFPKYTTYSINVKELKNSDLKSLEEEKKSGDNIRINLEGTKEEVDSFNKQELLNLGIKVEKKVEKVKQEVVEAEVEKYDNSMLKTYFSEFCTKNSLIEEEGIIYLDHV